MKFIRQGSVKDLYEVSNKEILFRFSDRYSVFDWGEMPDSIPGKGAALASMAKKLYSGLQSRGISTHLIGPGEKEEDLVVRKVGLGFHDAPWGYRFIPLEIIYRFGAPTGSSLLKKYKTETDWKKAGFDRAYREGEFFSQIHMDTTTKLEKIDRPLSVQEAKDLGQLDDRNWTRLLDFTQKVAQEIRTIFEEVGITLWDGKIELAIHSSGDLMLVDTIGLDETRLTFNQKILSKQLLRQFYLSTAWYPALEKAKVASPADFRLYCINSLKSTPPPLPPVILNGISDVYRIVSELILNKNKEEVVLLKQRLTSILDLMTADKIQ